MFKPGLAAEAVLKLIVFPCVVSPKLDGIRAVVPEKTLLSRSLKPIPNRYIQNLFNKCRFMDGELIKGSPTSQSAYRDTVSEVMAFDKTEGATFYVFDYIKDLTLPFTVRNEMLWDAVLELKHPKVVVLEHRWIENMEELLAFEQECLDMGYEGLIIRAPNAPYKTGRSTVKEGYILKLKRFSDAEAIVIGFEERMHNGNEATKNELGRTQRSSHKANMIGMDMLGALQVKFGEVEFSIGTGFTDEERIHIWNNRSSFLGKLAKFKSFLIGVKDLPRHPVFLGWRDVIDT